MHNPNANLTGWVNHKYRNHDDPYLKAGIAQASLDVNQIKSDIVDVIEKIIDKLHLAPPPQSRYQELPWSRELAAGEPLRAYAKQLEEILFWPHEKIIPLSNERNKPMDFAQFFAQYNKNEISARLYLEWALSRWGDKGHDGGDSGGRTLVDPNQSIKENMTRRGTQKRPNRSHSATTRPTTQISTDKKRTGYNKSQKL